jgi:hypothetical protein
MFHSPFKIFLAGFGSVDFSFGRFVAGLPESMRQDQAPTGCIGLIIPRSTGLNDPPICRTG